jgi:hypothetical protein
MSTKWMNNADLAMVDQNRRFQALAALLSYGHHKAYAARDGGCKYGEQRDEARPRDKVDETHLLQATEREEF